MKLILGITGAIAVAGAAAGALVATPASTAVRSGNSGLMAFVGYGQSVCGDDNATQQQGGTGKLVNKACYNTGAATVFPSVSTIGWLANASAAVNNTSAQGNAIGSSPMGGGAWENNGLGA